MELPQIVEALIFASPEPLTAKAIGKIIRGRVERERESANLAADPDPTAELLAKVDAGDVTEAIGSLNQVYEQEGHAFCLVEGPSGWRLYSHPKYAEWIRELFPDLKPAKLTPPALETLAIIAYRQPITKGDMEAVRGVSVDGVLQKIIDRGLVRIVGRADVPGRPLLYGTTEMFMEHFGIRNIDDLPNAAELRTIRLPNAEGGIQSPRETEKQLVLAATGSSATEPELNLTTAPESPSPPEAATEEDEA